MFINRILGYGLKIKIFVKIFKLEICFIAQIHSSVACLMCFLSQNVLGIQCAVTPYFTMVLLLLNFLPVPLSALVVNFRKGMNCHEQK